MREYKLDNIKFFLIFCVVFGHMQELFHVGGMYKIIYSFHMPAFVFLSGYFSKFNQKKIVMSLICPYVLFQILYLFFDAIVVKQDLSGINIQFTTPYWLLWYLLVMIFYHMLLPFMESDRHPAFLVATGVILSLASGFDQSIGYYMSLSRFFFFLPYFILGVVWRRIGLERLQERIWFRVVNIAVVSATCFFLGGYSHISTQMLYGSYSYQSGGGSLLIRGLLFIAGMNWICFFMWFFTNKKIPLISSIGKNTMAVFLAHGFIRKYLESRGGIFVYSQNINMGLAMLVSLIILVLFGNKYIGSGFRRIFTGKGIGAFK